MLPSLPFHLNNRREKFLILVESNVFILSFIVHAFWVVVKKFLQISKSLRFYPMLSSRHFIILVLTCSYVHFDLILYMVLRKDLSSFCFAYGCPVVPEPFVKKKKKLSSHHWITLSFLLKENQLIGCISGNTSVLIYLFGSWNPVSVRPIGAEPNTSCGMQNL